MGEKEKRPEIYPPPFPRYADNILKGFANSISIILTGLISYLFMGDFVLSGFFVVGSILVVIATYVYGLPDKSAPPAPVPVLPKAVDKSAS